MSRRDPRAPADGWADVAPGDGLHALAGSLDAYVRALAGPRARVLTGIGQAWRDAVGPTVAAHAQPVRLDGDVLVVEVDDPGWATQLRYLGAEVVARLATVGLPTPVARIEVRVRRSRPGDDPSAW